MYRPYASARVFTYSGLVWSPVGWPSVSWVSVSLGRLPVWDLRSCVSDSLFSWTFGRSAGWTVCVKSQASLSLVKFFINVCTGVCVLNSSASAASSGWCAVSREAGGGTFYSPGCWSSCLCLWAQSYSSSSELVLWFFTLLNVLMSLLLLFLPELSLC